MLALVAVFISPMVYGLYTQFDLQPNKEFELSSGMPVKGISGLQFYFWDQSFGRITGDNKEWENDSKEVKASKIFEPLYSKKKISKPETIQYFIEQCEQRIYIPFSKKEIQSMFPKYLIDAIEFVTCQTPKEKEEEEVCQEVTTSY